MRSFSQGWPGGCSTTRFGPSCCRDAAVPYQCSPALPHVLHVRPQCYAAAGNPRDCVPRAHQVTVRGDGRTCLMTQANEKTAWWVA